MAKAGKARGPYPATGPMRHPGRRTNTMNIRPLQDRIVIKRLEGETVTKGGIIIPDSAKEKPIEGRVIAVGNGKWLKNGKARPVDVKVGDIVLFGKYSGNEIKIDGEEHMLLRESDVIAVMRSGEEAAS